jgi:Tol biopolymer transport system component/DNA-binding winged helix-turn-helix (wHTH) protein
MSVRPTPSESRMEGSDDPVIELAQEAPFDLDGLRVEPSLARVALPDGVRQLQPRVMQVLIALARRAGETVSRDELMRLCWGDVVVGEDALTRAVLRLRNLFEEAGGTVTIETVPRIGYRLNGTVRPLVPEAADEVASPPHADAATPPAPLQQRRPVLVLGVAILLLVVAAIGLVLQLPAAPGRATAELRMTPVTFEPGMETSPALSPDGGQLVYVGQDQATERSVLMLRSVAGGDPVKLTEDFAYQPAWSPDGGRIAYARPSAGGVCRLFVRPVPSGPEREVGRCTGPGLTSLTWAPDGRGLIYSDRTVDGVTRHLVQRDLTGGRIETLTDPPTVEVGDERPALSPDGTRVAFVRVHQSGNEDVAVLELATRRVRVLFAGADSIESVAWMADGRSVLATGYGPNGGGLWQIDAESGARRILLGGQRHVGTVGNARLKDRIVLETVIRRENLSIVRVRDDGPSDPEPLLEASSIDRLPEFSPDGQRLVFVSDRAGRPDLWVSEAPFRVARRLTEFNAGEVRGPNWSPDGKHIAVTVGREGSTQLLLVDAQSGHVTVFRNEPLLYGAVWSPKSDALFYLCKDDQGWRVQRARLADRNGSTTIANNVQSAGSGLDDTHLLVRLAETGGFYKLPIEGGPLVPLEPPPADLERALWASRAGALYGIYVAAQPELLRIDAETGRTRILSMPRELNWSGGMAVSPDGSQIVLSRVSLRESDLNLVDLK